MLADRSRPSVARCGENFLFSTLRKHTACYRSADAIAPLRLAIRRSLIASVLLLAPPLWCQAGVQVLDSQTLAALESALAEPDSFADAAEAQVWLTDMSTRLQNRVPDPERRVEMLRAIHREATRAGVPPEMVLAVIEIESNFDHAAISSAGARGLMQVMPFWKNELGREEDNLLTMHTNLRYGTTILAQYYAQEKGNWVRALNRYNGRLKNNPYAGKVLDALRLRWFRQ